MQKENVNRLFRVLALTAASAMLFCGCADKKSEETVSQGTVTYAGEEIYPVSSEDELTLWIPLTAVVAAQVSNFGDTLLAAEMEKAIGAKVTYIHPASGMEAEQFTILNLKNHREPLHRANIRLYLQEPPLWQVRQ